MGNSKRNGGYVLIDLPINLKELAESQTFAHIEGIFKAVKSAYIHDKPVVVTNVIMHTEFISAGTDAKVSASPVSLVYDYASNIGIEAFGFSMFQYVVAITSEDRVEVRQN